MGACGETRTKDPRKVYSTTELEYFFKQTENCLCKIKSHNIGYGTGFLCIISFQQKNDLPVLITNNYILDNDDISKDKNIIFYLEDNKHKIKIDNSRRIYTNDNYNIIIIEIKKEDKLDIKSFFKIDDNIFRDNLDYLYYGHYVYLLYYGKDKKPRHSKGEIQNINIKNNTFEHLCQCEIETLGAPILDLSNHKVIGIHKGIKEGNNINLGFFLKEPFKEYYKLYFQNNNSKSTNSESKESKKSRESIKEKESLKSRESIKNKVSLKNKESDNEINLKFLYTKEKELYLVVKDNISFKEVIKELYNKFIWLNNIKIIDFQVNGKSLSKDKTVKENNLNENSTIIIIEEKAIKEDDDFI